MIDPFIPHQVRASDAGEPLISFGCSSIGYDIRLAPEFMVFRGGVEPLDPHNVDPTFFNRAAGDRCVIPANGIVLGRSIERFRMPPDVAALCVSKSTLARCGLILNTTPFEPGWEGTATLEISNTAPRPVIIRAGEGIGQVVFFKAADRPSVTYADRGGKYQNQVGVTLARVGDPVV